MAWHLIKHRANFILLLFQHLSVAYMRAVCKVRGLIIPSGNFVRCGDGLFFEVLPLASDALLTTLHPLLENVQQPRNSLFVVGKAQKSHGARSGLYGGCSNGVPQMSVRASIAAFQSRNADAPLCCSTVLKMVLLKRPNSVFEKWVECCKKCIVCQGR
jgi:hypothetical protein